MNSKPVFAVDEVLSRVDDDRDLLQELVGLLTESLPESFESIELSITSGDPVALGTAAHSIKSALANLGAMRAADVAFSLERLGKSGSTQNSSGLFSLLRSEVSDFQKAIEEFMKQG